MYQPDHFKEVRLEVLHELITAHPFGLLISTGADGIEANGLPFFIDRKAVPLGALRVHMARANDQWKNLSGQNVLVVFQGPHTYISPSLYPSKIETGKVVPTWNYVMVQARGVARVNHDSTWLGEQVETLTKKHEARQPTPWAVHDAPKPYIASQLRGIVGIEIQIQSLEGKWKVSQNRPIKDRRGVAEGLANENSEMSALVSAYGEAER